MEVLSARNALQSNHGMAFNVQKCSGCNTVHFKNGKPIRKLAEREDFKRLRTKCTVCPAHFCWNCGQQFGADSNHICDGDLSSQYGIANILSECPLKQVG